MLKEDCTHRESSVSPPQKKFLLDENKMRAVRLARPTWSYFSRTSPPLDCKRSSFSKRYVSYIFTSRNPLYFKDVRFMSGKHQKGRKATERRHNDYVKAKRRKDISDAWWGVPYYSDFHRYVKGKIHCSCGMCRAKTKNKGKHRQIKGNYAPSYNPKHSDRQRDVRMANQLDEYYYWLAWRLR